MRSRFDAALGGLFQALGRQCALHPRTVLGAGSLTTIVLLALCIAHTIPVRYESRPEKLWVPQNAQTKLEKDYYDAHFDPFYRIAQIIVVPLSPGADVIDKDVFLDVYHLQEQISAISTPEGVKLDDLCYKPVAGRGCVVTSPLDFWLDGGAFNVTRMLQDPDLHQTASCIPSVQKPLPCQGVLGQPIVLKTVLGRLSRSSSGSISGAGAAIITYLLRNTAEDQVEARLWEAVFLQTVSSFSSPRVSLAYSSERSIEDELGRMNNNMALKVVVIVSYFAMFTYIAIALGRFPHPVQSRFLLGLAGVLVVAASLLISIVLCSIAGVKITPIISQVMPFLLLAIGVDNMFIMVKAFDRTRPILPIPSRLALTMGHVGPSIALASITESLAFFFGALTRIPALQALCIATGVAVLADLVLQVTCFASAIAWDAQRMQTMHMDCLPCFSCAEVDYIPINTYMISSTMANTYQDITTADYNKAVHGIDSGKEQEEPIRRLIQGYYAPFVVRKSTKIATIVLFGLVMLASVYGFTHLQLGLDQRQPLPYGSYLKTYFDALDEYVDVGPPLYIVTTSKDLSSRDAQVGLELLKNSVAGLQQYVAAPVFSWYADLKRWAQYCRGYLLEDGRYVPAEQFVSWTREFVSQNLDDSCCVNKGLCGGAYAQDIAFNSDTGQIESTRFRTFHQSLKNQTAFVQAFQRTHSLVQAAPQSLTAFGYSVFYIYYEQYSYIANILLLNIAFTCGAVLVTTGLVLGSLRTAVLVTLCVAMCAIDIIGVMALLSIPLNAVSAVNVVVAAGLSIEFVVHIARAFLLTAHNLSRDQRAQYALTDMGSSVFTGIGLTKLIGVLVLAFAPSALFRTYYFCMLLAIVIIGLLHGLLVLPVLLTLVGPKSSNQNEQEEETSPLLRST
mmetsp:Transcript_16341/g.26800  ORF Transcript_16341/g.26800 Transcript_16341/m.26800 type:complete len:902 (+) Transcript_16341:21-2726(+)